MSYLSFSVAGLLLNIPLLASGTMAGALKWILILEINIAYGLKIYDWYMNPATASGGNKS